MKRYVKPNFHTTGPQQGGPGRAWGRRAGGCGFHCVLALWTMAVFGLWVVRLAVAESLHLVEYSSRYYTIYSDLPRGEVAGFGRHMDAVFQQYSRRFRSFGARDGRPMPLYLFRTRDRYAQFLDGYGIDASGSGGMFFIRRDIEGLATYTEGRTRSSTFEVLQHEGFHQFAHAYIGPDLPLWVNEGLAEYFADGILIRNKMSLGMANDRRVMTVQAAIRQRRAIDFDLLLEIQPEQWKRNMVDDPELGGLQYDQSWSLVHFLIHGDGGKYRTAFEQYLLLVNQGQASRGAFRLAFGADNTVAFRRRWTRYLLTLKPDPLTTAVSNMEFLAEGLKTLKQHNIPLPNNLDDLRSVLQKVQFRSIRTHHNLSIENDAMDESLYQYRAVNGANLPFELLEAEADSLLPRIVATGLNPQPILIWLRQGNELIPDVTYR